MPRKVEDWISSYLDYVDETEPSMLYKKWVAISTIAACLQRKVFINWGLLQFYPNLFVVLVGPSGAQKGTAMSPAKNLLEMLGIPLVADSITKEKLVIFLDEAGKNPREDPKTREPIVHSSLTAFATELTVFVRKDDLDFMSYLNKWYDCENSFRYETKNKGSNIIPYVWFNLLGATTPGLVQDIFARNAVALGLSSRIIYIYSEKKEKTISIPTLSDEARELYKALLSDLSSMLGLYGVFKITEDFVEVYSSWVVYQDSTPPFSDLIFEGYCNRRRQHVLKLCMILNVSRGGDMLINAYDFNRALSILEEAEQVMPLVFRNVGKFAKADVLQRMIGMIELRGSISKSEVIRAFKNDLTMTEIDQMLQTLREAKICNREIGNPTGLGPEEVYIFIP